MRISDWSSDVCSSDLHARRRVSRQLRELSLQHLFGTEERIGPLEHQPRGWTSLEQGGEGLKQPVDSLVRGHRADMHDDEIVTTADPFAAPRPPRSRTGGIARGMTAVGHDMSAFGWGATNHKGSVRAA